MPIGDVYRWRSVCTYPQQISVNTGYVRCFASTGPAVGAATMAAAIEAILAPLYKPLMSSLASWRGVGCTAVFPALGVEATSVALAGVGTGTAAILPQQVSGLITLQTAVPRQHGRGRIYPGFLDAVWANASGYSIAGLRTALNALGTALTGPVVGVTLIPPSTEQFNFCVRSRTVAAGPPVVITLAYNTIVSAPAANRFATQRRRGQFGRVNVVPF